MLYGTDNSRERQHDSEAYFTKLASEPIGQVLDNVLRMADYPNVAVKWAHAPTMFCTPAWLREVLRPYFHKILAPFGPDRVMWASDVTVNQTGESWADLTFWIRNDPKLSDAEKANVLGGTATRRLSWEGDNARSP